MSGQASKRCQIVFLNDDYTPMEFVIHVLEDIFKMDRDGATRVMLDTHRQGTFPVATMDRAEAEATAAIVRRLAASELLTSTGSTPVAIAQRNVSNAAAVSPSTARSATLNPVDSARPR